MNIHTKIERGLANRWEELHNRKTTILSRCEQYAEWTLPYVFPRSGDTVKNDELPAQQDSIGAKAVNHLSNKIISTLFPARQLFFRLVIDQEMQDLISAALQEQVGSPEELKQLLQTQLQAAEDELLKAEKRVSDRLDMIQFRPQAINVAKSLIITGNSLIFMPEDDSPIQVYSLRNYSVVRDVSGEVVELMTRDCKAFATFKQSIQDQLRSDATLHKLHGDKKKYEDDTDVTIYTHVHLHEDGKYHVTQYADNVKLDTEGATYTKDELRWIPLTWNLIQGEDYGRGLVADYAAAFHAINVLSNALLNMAAIMGDIKIFVDPQSMIDVDRLERSAPGSYHAGKPENIGTMQMNMQNNAQFVAQMLDRYEKQIAYAFLLQSAMTRDAERVTAQEIQQNVDELETSNSGIYSRLAATWQYRTAILSLKDTDFIGVGDGVDPRIITGMDSLSRAGEAYNMRLFLADLTALNSLPEPVLQTINFSKFIKQVAQFHEVSYEGWVYTEQQVQQKQQEQQQAAQQLEETRQSGGIQKELVKQSATQGE